MAHQIAQEKYDLYPDWVSCFGQTTYAEHVLMSAKELLDTLHFLHLRIDKQVYYWGSLLYSDATDGN
jgi:RNA binding exosome subunit